MKIIGVEIEGFGKFKKYKMEFTEGMNFIFGNNEDGKTTMMAFIKMMFYSNLGSARDLSNLRKRYRPWDGGVMSGALEFEEDGKKYRIQKLFGQTASKDETSIVCLTDGQKIMLEHNEEVGEYFFHMQADSFERSMFIGQTGGFLQKDAARGDDISERLNNLTTSADENVSTAEVLGRLVSAKEGLISRRGNQGVLVDNRTRLERLKDEYRTAQEQESLQKELRDEYETQCALQAVEKERFRKITSWQGNTIQLLETLGECERAYSECDKKLSLKQMAVANTKERNNTEIKKVEEELAEAMKAADRPIEKDRKNMFLLLGLIFVAIGVATAFLVSPFCIIISASFFIFFSIGNNSKHRHIWAVDYRERMNVEVSKIEKKLAETKERTIKDQTSLEQAIAALTEEREQLLKRIEQKKENYSGPVAQNDSATELEREIMMRDEAINSIRERLREPERPMDEVRAEIRELTELVNRQQKYYDALVLAEKTMEQSVDEIRQSFGPQLSQNTAEIFSKLTKDRYRNVLVSRDYGISVLAEGDCHYRDWGYLSNGTIDQVYFSLRLAIKNMLSQNDNQKYPLFLDDIFEQYDEQRMLDGIEFLSDYTAKEKEQVLMFTCHKRILETARKASMPCTFLRLNGE